MIFICSTQVQNDNISRQFCFSKFWFFWVVRRVKGQKIAQNDKKLCPLQFISQEQYLQQFCFIFFKILIFGVFQSWSVNVKRKFWVVLHLLHMCVIFYLFFFFLQNDSPSETMKNVFYFIKKALSVLKIFKFLYFRLPLIFSLSAIVLEVDPRKILKFMMTSTV